MAAATIDPPTPPTFDPAAITRPDSRLLGYYTLAAAATVLGFPFVFLPLYFRYRTLRYRFDDDGVWMAWGLLWRREINLTYRRIQDIHLTRNLVQRWMGLATISIQTASGSAAPEASIDGILEADQLRDFLYQKMRSARGLAVDTASAPGPQLALVADDQALDEEALELLTQIRDALAALAHHRTGARP